jgi:hypothetical protein
MLRPLAGRYEMMRAMGWWVVMALVMGLAACGSEGSGGATPDTDADATVDVSDMPDAPTDATADSDGLPADGTEPDGRAQCTPPCADYEACEDGVCVGLPCELDCGDHGTCLGKSCVCDEGFGKVLCSGCADGHFGADCQACDCVNGVCDEGESGTGVCTCDDGWQGAACDEDPPPGVAFHGGPYGTGIFDGAAPFNVETLDGGWDYEAEWTGQDSHIFVLKWADSDYNTTIWNSDLRKLFERTPPNTHFFFGSFDGSYHEDVVAMQGKVDSALLTFSAADQAHWKAHTHFMDQQGTALTGGLGDYVNAKGLFWFAIDRYGQWREIGSLYEWPTGEYPIHFLGNEPYNFNYELEIDEARAAMNAHEVVVMDDIQHGGGWGGGANTYVMATFPGASQMAQYNRMAIHLWMRCPDHLQGKDNGCPEWDRTELIYLCDQAYGAGAAQPVEAACQPHVPVAEEQMGLCGGVEGASCMTDGDCEGEVTCDGYAAPAAEVPADTISCTCQKPEGSIVDVDRACRADGTGYDACPCACNRELARWITTYGREGRWLTDLTPYLPLVSAGGPQFFRFSGNNGQPLDMEILLYTDETPERASSMRYLWGNPWGTAFNASYNDGKHSDVIFEVPEGTARVEVAALITGHGNGTTAEGCAEFCPFQSEYTLNGSTFTKDHPWAGTGYGCYDQIADGVVANQFGSWPFGRAGWCPGQDVKIWTFDVTDLLVDGENTITHRGTLGGVDYVPTVTADGYMPELVMSSWLVFYEATE